VITDIREFLENRGVRPSPQRLAIHRVLRGRRDHPNVETVYRALKDAMPTLSLTTVYSTLKLFAELGLVQEVRTEDGEIRYDPFTQFHAHFKCRRCGALQDVPVPAAVARPFATLPVGCVAEQEQLVYFGLCATCAGKGSSQTKTNNRSKAGEKEKTK